MCSDSAQLLAELGQARDSHFLFFPSVSDAAGRVWNCFFAHDLVVLLQLSSLRAHGISDIPASAVSCHSADPEGEQGRMRSLRSEMFELIRSLKSVSRGAVPTPLSITFLAVNV